MEATHTLWAKAFLRETIVESSLGFFWILHHSLYKKALAMIVGLCRFSYLARGGWARQERVLNDQAAYLFAEDRLKQRLRFFRTLTLPSIAQQTDPDFQFIVLSSSLLPKKCCEELQSMLEDVPNAELVLLPPQHHRRAIRTAYDDKFGEVPNRISFRIDDDDGLSIDFIRRLKNNVSGGNMGGSFFISFCKGVTIVHESGKMTKAAIMSIPFSSAGLALCAPPPAVVYDYPHQRCFADLPAITIPGEPAFIRSIHDENDSGPMPLRFTNKDWEAPDALLARHADQFPYVQALGSLQTP